MNQSLNCNSEIVQEVFQNILFLKGFGLNERP